MKSQPPVAARDEHRVVEFRPRAKGVIAGGRIIPEPPGNAAGSDDFRHRMLANAAALVFTIALTGFGIWLAVSIADLRKTQDCVLMGRRDCAHLARPVG